MTPALRPLAAVLLCLALTPVSAAAEPSPCTPVRATGDLGIVVERAVGKVKIVETTGRTAIGEVEGLGDLSHASVLFSRDGRYVFVFGRDGGLNKVDLLQAKLVGRVVQAGNSIGGAISQDGSLVAVANYEPGGVNIFDAATLEKVGEIAAVAADGSRSKVVGLEDAGGNRFVFSLYDAGEIWIADLADRSRPELKKFTGIGRQPYDALVTGNGRWYVAGLFGEDALVVLDLWRPEAGVRRILKGYRKGEEQLPVYKMPHLEGWAQAGELMLLADLKAEGKIARVGAIVRPNSIGASTLAAMRVPADRLEHVAEAVSRRPEVNHCYQREHDINVWFVVIAADRAEVLRVLNEIAAETGEAVLDLPMVEPYHIDLGFDLRCG